VSADEQCLGTASIAGPSLPTDGSIVLTQSPPGPYARGSHSVELTVSPALSCDGATSCRASVEVVDRTPPPLACPDDVTVACTGEVTAVTLPDPMLGSDNCGTSILFGCAHSAFHVGSNTVSCTAADGSSNESACTFQVQVVDRTPPELTVPRDLTGVECTSPAGASPALGDATAIDRCDSSPDVGNDAPPVLPRDVNTVTWTATDASGNSVSATQTVEVVDTTPPTIRCPEPATVECTSDHGAPFTPAPATASDICTGVAVTSPPAGVFPTGTTVLAYSAADETGLTAGCASSVTVDDTTPPGITTLGVTPTQLWPPDHKMRTVTLAVAASDACDPAAPVCRLTAIGSNEPVNGLGDGDTAPDWEITGPLTALLRSERGGGPHTLGSPPNPSRPGRIYTLEVTCTDDAGNATVGTTTVGVPHDERKK
jgi:hypothetical protein